MDVAQEMEKRAEQFALASVAHSADYSTSSAYPIHPVHELLYRDITSHNILKRHEGSLMMFAASHAPIISIPPEEEEDPFSAWRRMDSALQGSVLPAV